MQPVLYRYPKILQLICYRSCSYFGEESAAIGIGYQVQQRSILNPDPWSRMLNLVKDSESMWWKHVLLKYTGTR